MGNSSSLEAAKRLTQSDQGTCKEGGAQCKSQYLHCQKQTCKVYEGQRMQEKSYLGVEEEDTGGEGGQEERQEERQEENQGIREEDSKSKGKKNGKKSKGNKKKANEKGNQTKGRKKGKKKKGKKKGKQAKKQQLTAVKEEMGEGADDSVRAAKEILGVRNPEETLVGLLKI